MVTWKDYEGPNLSPGHFILDLSVPGYLAEHIEENIRNGNFDCCVDEKRLREEWADKQNIATQKGDWSYAQVPTVKGSPVVRTFDTGANRDLDNGKLDYEGFLSPLALRAYATFMHFNRSLADGSTRASDNWQKGIPKDVYVKSGWRHWMALWSIHRGWGAAKETIVWAACGVLFNVSGLLHELLKADPELLDRCLAEETKWRDAARASLSKPQS